MRGTIGRLIRTGVGADQPHAQQRRVKAVNVIACIAFSITTLFATAFFASGRTFIGDTSYIVFFGGTLISLAGYVLVIALNARHLHTAAAATALSAGTFNLVVSVFVVGFATGPAGFFVMIPVGAILATNRDTLWLRWIFIGVGIGAYGAMAIIDPPVAEGIKGTNVETMLDWFNYAGLVGFAAAVVWYQQDLADTAEEEMAVANQRSESLLLNILPAPIAERLKDGESPIADRIEHVAVLFGDIVGSTPLAERLTADELVVVLDEVFSGFDAMAAERGLEKIKTIGDAYMVVGGLEPSSDDPDARIADMALAMRDSLSRRQLPGGGTMEMRFGMASGPVVAGVIGNRKFSYDLWGDTVNTAARMETDGVPGKIQVTEPVRKSLEATHRFSDGRSIDVRGKGAMTTYFLLGRLPIEPKDAS